MAIAKEGGKRGALRLLPWLLSLVLVGVLLAQRPQSGSLLRKAPSEADPTIQEAFEYIYANHKWGQAGNGSGTGSTLVATTRTRTLLLETIETLDIHSMIDVPCGGMTWQPLVLQAVQSVRRDFRYIGLDIARPVVQSNKERFSDQPWKFSVLDMSRQPLPRGYDLIHMRDVLQHLQCPAVVASLRNIAASDARFAMITSYNAPNNQPILRQGGYTDLNLRRPPFNLVPDAVLSEDTPLYLPKISNKLYLVFRLETLRKVDFDMMRLRCSCFSSNVTRCTER